MVCEYQFFGETHLINNKTQRQGSLGFIILCVNMNTLALNLEIQFLILLFLSLTLEKFLMFYHCFIILF